MISFSAVILKILLNFLLQWSQSEIWTWWKRGIFNFQKAVSVTLLRSMVQIHTTFIIFALIVPLPSVVPYSPKHSHRFSPYAGSFSADDPSRRSANRLLKNFIGDDGRVYACSGKDFFAFERNGSVAWTVHLNYTCREDIPPVHGGSTKIYLVAENRVLKIFPLENSEAAVEVFFGAEGSGEIIGIYASISSSCVIINVKNRGLFAYRWHGQLIWSAGPVLYQHGYRLGCRKNITDCYFTSPPVIDHCEASIFISNTVGELYSLSVRGPYFKWIQDLSTFGSKYTIFPGNNGRLYVIIPDTTIVLALDVSTGNILWQGSFGPLSSWDYEPVIDANGWISFGSLDGYLYSFSPTGELKKFPEHASLNSVIQVSPVLDCSGYGVYISQTEMEGKISQETAQYTYVAALKPKNAVFIFLVPAFGSVYWSERNPSKFLFNLSQSDLQHFVLDERTLLAFFAVSRNGDPLPCRSTRQKLASSCSQVKPKSITLYTGNKRTITLFLLIESVILVLLLAAVRYCFIFWKKKRLQGLNLGKFLQKRRSLRSQKKAFDRMITELEQKASEEAVSNEVLENLGDLVKKREGIKRKLSTTYSLGRDSGGKSLSKSLLPLSGGKSRSYSFQGSKKESVTIFHTFSDSSSTASEEYTSPLEEENEENLCEEDDEFVAKAKAKGKAPAEVESCSDVEKESSSAPSGFVKPLFLEHSFSEMADDEMENTRSESRRLRRRTMSFH